MRFQVGESGSLIKGLVTKSSGNATLDRTALRILREALINALDGGDGCTTRQ